MASNLNCSFVDNGNENRLLDQADVVATVAAVRASWNTGVTMAFLNLCVERPEYVKTLIIEADTNGANSPVYKVIQSKFHGLYPSRPYSISQLRSKFKQSVQATSKHPNLIRNSTGTTRLEMEEKQPVGFDLLAPFVKQRVDHQLGHLREPGQMFAGQGSAAVADAAQVEVEAPAVIEVAPVREVGAARDIAGGQPARERKKRKRDEPARRDGDDVFAKFIEQQQQFQQQLLTMLGTIIQRPQGQPPLAAPEPPAHQPPVPQPPAHQPPALQPPVPQPPALQPPVPQPPAPQPPVPAAQHPQHFYNQIPQTHHYPAQYQQYQQYQQSVNYANNYPINLNHYNHDCEQQQQYNAES